MSIPNSAAVGGDYNGAPDVNYQRGRDIWIRARTNAMAHKIDASRINAFANVAFALEALFLVVPIVCVGLALESVNASKALGPHQEVHVLSPLILSITAIISNGMALFIRILSKQLQWEEHAQRHRELLSGYQLIAQKARRLENMALSTEERNHLVRHLEETFEVYKMVGLEPAHETFVRAQKVMANLNTYPFGLARDFFGTLEDA
jgi:hypothetical protein